MYEAETNLFVKNRIKDFIKWGEKFAREWTHKSVDELEGLKNGEEFRKDNGVEDKDQEVHSRDEQVAEWPEQVGEGEAVHTEEPNKNSQELSFSSVSVSYSPPSQQPITSCEFSSDITTRSTTYWRPWEGMKDGDILTSFDQSLVTPPKPYFSSMSVKVLPQPLTPQGRLLRRAKKRSAGDLAKRRQRLVSFQLSHTPPSTTNKSEPALSPLSEPEQSLLESGSWESHPGSWSLDLRESSASRKLDLGGSNPQPGIPLVLRRQMEDYSNLINPHLLYPLSPQSWLPSPSFATSTSPCPCPPPTPPSPAYCDGCQRWGNLLSVTVSQTRAN